MPGPWPAWIALAVVVGAGVVARFVSRQLPDWLYVLLLVGLVAPVWLDVSATAGLLDIGAAAAARDAAAGAVVAGARRAAREKVQRESMARLEGELDLPRAVLPLLFEDGGSPAGTRKLAALF